MRLVASAAYRRVQAEGSRSSSADLVFLALASAGEGARVGLTVSRRVGGAVVRNRVKRRLREAVRHERTLLGGGVDVVIIARPSAAGRSQAELREQVRRAFQRIGQRGGHAKR